ncbi:hypothetical protein HN358_02890 [Candidatus Uhrbacteria bacterium]|jgi:hypothetical protein|nr:hypothetical protein [Candidatus Uhrbacteria bacterium]MBT7717147.1 hypothetical protein [Candidatus Uhrbacteria bacterium]
MRKYIALAAVALLLGPTLVFAQLDPSETGLDATGAEVYGTLDQTLGQWVGTKIITPALALVGLIFLVLMVYAGFLWMTAGGASDQVQKAKDLMIRAVIGVIIITAAYAITTYIFTALNAPSL